MTGLCIGRLLGGRRRRGRAIGTARGALRRRRAGRREAAARGGRARPGRRAGRLLRVVATWRHARHVPARHLVAALPRSGSPTPTSRARRAYVQALRAAAQDGVDVRLLVPGAGTTSRSCGRLPRRLPPAARGGGARLRVERRPMMHAKTAVADGHWARIGSTNLNVASWIGNWELDVVSRGRRASARDGGDVRGRPRSSTEIVLGGRRLLGGGRSRCRLTPLADGSRAVVPRRRRAAATRCAIRCRGSRTSALARTPKVTGRGPLGDRSDARRSGTREPSTGRSQPHDRRRLAPR